MMHNPLVYLIILNWNGMKDTLECLESVRAIEYPNCKIVVVDNGSDDNSCAKIEKQFHDVILIRNGENLGFAEGNNVGIRYALEHNADYILLLNNDTIVDDQIIKELISASRKFDDKGIFGAQIFYYSEKQKVWYAGVKWVSSDSVFYHLEDRLNQGVIKETDYACGCALFLSAKIIEKIGLLDRRYFLTFEEADWCYRAKHEGIKSYCVANAIVYHKISNSFGGSSSPLISYYLTRNSLLWGERYLSLKEFKELLINTVRRIQWLSDPHTTYKNRLVRNVSLFMRHYKGEYTSVTSHACYLGIRDYLLRKFGNCPTAVLSLLKVDSVINA